VRPGTRRLRPAGPGRAADVLRRHARLLWTVTGRDRAPRPGPAPEERATARGGGGRLARPGGRPDRRVRRDRRRGDLPAAGHPRPRSCDPDRVRGVTTDQLTTARAATGSLVGCQAWR